MINPKIVRRKVFPAQSVNNVFLTPTTSPENSNIGLTANNWSNVHLDAYSSDSTDLTGPLGISVSPQVTHLIEVQQYENKYNGMLVIACTSKGVLLGTAVDFTTGETVLTAYSRIHMGLIGFKRLGLLPPTSFRGGYFFLDRDDNVLVINNDSTLSLFKTSSLTENDSALDEANPIENINLIWKTTKIIIPGQQSTQELYGAVPVGSPDINTDNTIYWVMTTSDFNPTNQNQYGTSVAIIRINGTGTVTPEFGNQIGIKHYLNEWNNNTLTACQDGLYFITNSSGSTNSTNLTGYVHALNAQPGLIAVERWANPITYTHTGYMKRGDTNTGSGTTVTLMDDPKSLDKMLIFADNSEPKMKIRVFKDRLSNNPVEIGGTTPVGGGIGGGIEIFKNRRSGTEASMAAYGGYIFVGSHFGHTIDPGRPQLVPTEPGIVCLKVDPTDGNQGSIKEIWFADRPINVQLGISILARTNGVLYVCGAEWPVDRFSLTEGEDNTNSSEPEYFVAAYDTWDGRIIWKLPIGSGWKGAHEYSGAAYFDRNGSASSNSLYIGTNGYLVKITADTAGFFDNAVKK